MAELLPGAELDPPLEGAGHFLQEDRGEAVAERIAAWLHLRPNSYGSEPHLHT
jgi:pimeloyl-ACP methyl ester carboxylesterase